MGVPLGWQPGAPLAPAVQLLDDLRGHYGPGSGYHDPALLAILDWVAVAIGIDKPPAPGVISLTLSSDQARLTRLTLDGMDVSRFVSILGGTSLDVTAFGLALTARLVGNLTIEQED